MLRVATLTLAVLLLLPQAPERALADPASASAPRPVQILSEDTIGDRRVFAVRLAARSPEAELRRIAEELARRGRGAPRTLVKFYLVDMPQDQSPWATATITSQTTVAISGLSLEDAELLAAEARADRRVIVGVWLTSPPAAPGRLTIYREGHRLFAEWRLRSGLKTVDALDEVRIPRGRRYTIAGETTGSLVVTHAGDLELREGEQVIAKGERIPLDRPAAPVAATPPVVPPMALGARRVVAPAGPEAAQAGVAEPVAQPAEPVTAAPVKPAPRKRAARPAVPKTPKSARVVDTGPVMKLQGQ